MIRTNRGKLLDMEALTKKYENSIAVSGGGSSMNARGDLIGLGGKIIKRVEQREKENQAIEKPEAQKVKLSDLRKFAGQTSNNGEDLRSAMAAGQDKAKLDAKRVAKKVELATQSLVSGGQPIINDYTESESLDPPEISEKKPRRIVDSKD